MKWLALTALAGMFVLAGCASAHRDEALATNRAVLAAPAVVSVLTGPESVLLTNLDELTARATFTLNDAPDGPSSVSGDLLVSHGKIAFRSDRVGKQITGQFEVVWDTTAAAGWVISEDLQGFAPISTTNRFQILQREVDPASGAMQADHPVQTAIVTLYCPAGPMIRRRVWQAADLNSLALRIETADSSASPALSLQSVRPQAPTTTLFHSPDDLTKYPDVTALLNELLARQHSVYDTGEEFHGNLGPMLAPGEQSHNPGYVSQPSPLQNAYSPR